MSANQQMLLASKASASATEVDMLVKFEDSSDGTAITTTILGAATLGGGGGTWSIFTTPSTDLKIATAAQMTASGFAVSGVGSPDTGTRGMALNQNIGRQFIEFTFGSTQSTVSLGFAFKLSSNFAVSPGFQSFDFAMFVAGGDYFALNFSNTPSQTADAHSAAGKGSDISLSSYINIPVWVTMRFAQNGTSTLKIYELSTMTLIGSSTIAQSNVATSSIQFGHCDNVGSSRTGDNWYDNIAIKFGSTTELLPS